jgi:biotin carboxyl carrier protein
VNEPILLVRVVAANDGRFRVLSPGVGWWSAHPHPGALVGPGSQVGLFASLHKRFALVLPDPTAGRTVGALPRKWSVPVEYGQVLFELAPVDPNDEAGTRGGAGALGRPADADLPEGGRAVVSPTDGFFYRRPSPGAEPFVEVGTRVRLGDPLGLVEVMKTFNQILFGGPGFPDEAEVVAIRVGDAEEVRAGQVLMVVR